MFGRLRHYYGSLSLRAKLVFAIVLPQILVLAIVLSFTATHEIAESKESEVENMEAIVLALHEDFDRYYTSADPGLAKEITEVVELFESIERLYVYDSEGKVIFSYNQPQLADAPVPPANYQQPEFTGEILQMYIRLKHEQSEQGPAVVYIRCFAKELQDELHATGLTLLGAGCGAALLGLLIAFILEGFISQPIRELKRTAARVIDTNDYSVRAGKSFDDEIGKVTDAFNIMLERIQSTHAEIEARVEERTAALRASERRFRQLLESAPDAILIVDHVGDITLSNAKAEEIFGYEQKELIGKHLDTLLPGYLSKKNTAQNADYLSIIAQYELDSNLEQSGRRKDGSEFSVEISTALASQDGSLVSVGIRDISQRKMLESQLAQAKKLESIGQLAAGIAHEINTPIQFIGDNTRFIQETFTELNRLFQLYRQMLATVENSESLRETAAQAKSALDEIDLDYVQAEIPRAIADMLEGVGRVSSIVLAMKEFSHPGVEDKIGIDLNKALESTITVSRNEWKYVAELTTAFDRKLPLVQCLPGEINQVFLNIIVNAAHAIGDKLKLEGSKGKGAIAIETSQHNGWVQVRIRDSGTGIPEKIRTRIFDPFFTTKDVGRGTGQGLAISRSVVVDKHNGELTFETELGQGTTFIIRLPI